MKGIASRIHPPPTSPAGLAGSTASDHTQHSTASSRLPGQRMNDLIYVATVHQDGTSSPPCVKYRSFCHGQKRLSFAPDAGAMSSKRRSHGVRQGQSLAGAAWRSRPLADVRNRFRTSQADAALRVGRVVARWSGRSRRRFPVTLQCRVGRSRRERGGRVSKGPPFGQRRSLA